MRHILLSSTEAAIHKVVPWAPDPSKPVVYYYPDKKVWRLKSPYVYQDGEHKLTIPAPFDFDLASVPRILWPLISSFELGIEAPLVHDWLYRYGGHPTGRWGSIEPLKEYSRKEADQLFNRQIKESRVPTWKRRAAYAAVRVFGRIAWKKNWFV